MENEIRELKKTLEERNNDLRNERERGHQVSEQMSVLKKDLEKPSEDRS